MLTREEYKKLLHGVYSALCSAEGTIENAHADAKEDEHDEERAEFLQDLLHAVQELTNSDNFDQFK